jgi:hypothetical protein
VHEFNGRLLELLAQAARSDVAHRHSEIVREHRELWLALDPVARERASRCPFLLVELHFRNPDWWRWAREERSWRSRAPATPGLLPRKLAVEVMYDALVVVWHAARLDARVAAILFAMTAEVSGVVATLGLRHLRQMAEHHHRELRPRWEQLSTFWGRLLSAARSGDPETLFDLHLHGFQLLHADWQTPPSPASPRSPAPRTR